MKTLRNLVLFLLFGAAAIALVAVALVDPPAPKDVIETDATLPAPR